MNKTEYALESFKNIQNLIKFIDQKSGAVLVIAGLIFTGYIEFLKDIELTIPKSATFFEIVTFIAILVTAISLIIVIYISIFKVLKPRLAKNYKKDEFSLFYFEHLSALGKEDVSIQYQTLDDQGMLKHIIDQQHEVSEILKRKTSELGKSFNYLFISIFSLIIFIISSLQL